MCPLKVYFKLFIDFTRPRNPHRITHEMAEKYFKIFMHESKLIILKKLELIDFVLMQTEPRFQFDDDIINALTSRFIMCLEFFKSTMRRGGFSKDFYNTVLKEFNDLSQKLRDDALTALGRLKGRLTNSIIRLQVSHEDDEQLAFFLERKRDVDRMITDLNKLIPLINASSELFDQNSERTIAATVQDTAEGRQRRQRRLQELQVEQQELQQPQYDNGGGRKSKKM